MCHIKPWVSEAREPNRCIFRISDGADIDLVYFNVPYRGIDHGHASSQCLKVASSQDIAGKKYDHLIINFDLAAGTPLAAIKYPEAMDQGNRFKLTNPARTELHGRRLQPGQTRLGLVSVVGSVYIDITERDIISAESVGAEPQFWSVYAQRVEGVQFMENFPTQQRAEEYVKLLALDERIRDRINEEQVRLDPNSTDEAILAAKQIRKDAEFTETITTTTLSPEESVAWWDHWHDLIMEYEQSPEEMDIELSKIGEPPNKGESIYLDANNQRVNSPKIRKDVEIAATMILGDELGIGHDPSQHTDVAAWIKAIEEDPLEIIRAAADAEKIQDYVLGLEQKQIQEQSTQQDKASELGQVLVELQELHQSANQGYSPLASWENLKKAAQKNGLTASISRGGDGDGPPYVVTYADHFGQETALITDFFNDGKVATSVNGQRVPGSDLTSDFEWQSEILRAALNQQEVDMRYLESMPQIHLITSKEFAQVAKVAPLENHEGRWEVFMGDQSYGFSDADTPAGAVREAHERQVGNALWSISATNPGSSFPIRDLPPEEVLAEYPELVDEFADNLSEASQKVVQKAFGLSVPHDWNGAAEVQGNVYEDVAQTHILSAASVGVEPQFWSVYAQRGEDAQPGEGAQWLQNYPTFEQAKDVAQRLASFDVHSAINEDLLERRMAVWERKQQAATQGHIATEKTWLAVPYEQFKEVKQLAGKLPNGSKAIDWDRVAKCWYANPGANLDKLKPWLTDSSVARQQPAMLPEVEFADALRSLGCVVAGEHPIMDGKKHRISVEGEKYSESAGSGFYVGHLDGHPAGYIKNNKTGIEIKWKSKGYVLDPELKAQMQAEAAAKLQARDAEHAKLQELAAQRVGRQMADLLPVEQPTAYMRAKGIVPQPGVFTDKEGQKTYIPATDVDGKQWTMQYIQEDGTKRFAKDSRKEGCFHVIGGMDELAKAPALVIGEGYATAGSLSQSLGFATVAAFDSGNLIHVAKALHEKFPDKPIILAGDDDKHLEATQGVNPGRSKAEEAAKAVGGKVLLPIFAPGEQSANPKGFTDFNDLANKSVLGREGIARQVNFIVESVIVKHQVKIHQTQEQRVRRAANIST